MSRSAGDYGIQRNDKPPSRKRQGFVLDCNGLIWKQTNRGKLGGGLFGRSRGRGRSSGGSRSRSRGGGSGRSRSSGRNRSRANSTRASRGSRSGATAGRGGSTAGRSRSRAAGRSRSMAANRSRGRAANRSRSMAAGRSGRAVNRFTANRLATSRTAAAATGFGGARNRQHGNDGQQTQKLCLHDSLLFSK